MEDLVILYEDNHLIVVLKPQNMPCCADDSEDMDLLTYIKMYLKERYNKPGNVYLGLVHRLDRPTGGIMVFAKTSKAASRLSKGMLEGDFEKRYLAVLVGKLKEKKGTLKNYLKKNAINNMVYVCSQTTEGGKYAELDYNVLEEIADCSLTEVRLHTGRSHQIRVQMAAQFAPVYGDMRYGGEKAKKGYLALWSYYLSFSHPVTNERLVFKAEPPKDIQPWTVFETAKYINVIKPTE